ncbi:retinoic acid early transcript 1E-like [Bubalus kerabau]|uniref:retinoic acid early transcript 1E-like n=1 Tax=Bubalus carabanensis TaxID=3119969 RepID=UPI00244EAD55|nr:retinoic acid early transcript 1E-like [Bubalus carabanensis]
MHMKGMSSDREVARGSLAGPRPRSWVPEVTAAAPRLTTGKSLVFTPATLGTSLQRLTHRPGGPPGAPSPERSTSARGPSSAPARGPRSSDAFPNAAGRASPEPGPRSVGPRFERAIQTENPEESFGISLVVANSTVSNARKRPWLDRAGEDRTPSISRPGQPWCQVQGSVDTKPFLQYDSDSNKVKPLGFLGKEVNDTEAWTEISQTLVEAGKELRMVLPVIKLDKNEMRGPPTLQVKLCCQREAEQCSGASLHFSLSGRTALLLDTMSITWTVIDPGATGIKEEWENNQELAEYFRTISTGDCSYWLREFLKHWEKMLLPEPTESLIMAADISQSASIRLVSSIILLIITQLVLIASSS